MNKLNCKLLKLFKHQLWHLLILLGLVYYLFFYAHSISKGLSGTLFGVKTYRWFILAAFSPILHQIYVLIGWRSELYYRVMTKLFKKNAFTVFKIGFVSLMLSRVVTIVFLAISNANTFSMGITLRYVLSMLLFIPVAYLFYSVKMYFGMDRAIGIDHFKREEMKDVPMVKGGLFKYVSNGMYIFGFLLLWLPGILCQSKAALLIALFNHVYIWVHYYFTELPDMKEIYGNRSESF